MIRVVHILISISGSYFDAINNDNFILHINSIVVCVVSDCYILSFVCNFELGGQEDKSIFTV